MFPRLQRSDIHHERAQIWANAAICPLFRSGLERESDLEPSTKVKCFYTWGWHRNVYPLMMESS